MSRTDRSSDTLRSLIELASNSIEEIFRYRHVVLAMCHAVLNDGDHLVFTNENDTKDEFFGRIAALCASGMVARYVFIDEAWIVAANTAAEHEELDRFIAAGGAVRNHPQRAEVIMFSAEDNNGQMMARRAIIRTGQTPMLGPLIIDPMAGTLEGPVVGLFAKGVAHGNVRQ